jgi:hypothetical protein
MHRKKLWATIFPDVDFYKKNQFLINPARFFRKYGGCDICAYVFTF